MPREAVLRALRRELVVGARSPESAAVVEVAAGFARQLAGAVPAVVGVLYFGSRMTGAGADAHSAHDLFVVVDDHAEYYRALAAAGWSRGRPALLAALNAWLSPNITSLSLPAAAVPGERWLAKAAVIRLDRLERESGSRRRDHFCIGRLFQPVEVIFARNEELHARLVAVLASALAHTYAWIRPWLPSEFDAQEYGRALLRLSLAGEIRPESRGRADQLWEAQRASMRPRLARLLAELALAGELRELRPGVYALARPVGRSERLRLCLYFARSKTRATARWLKHTWTFEDWLAYLVRKVERHGGQRLELTRRERAHPFVFLWPRFFRYLRRKE